jgi:hypothetical protein
MNNTDTDDSKKTIALNLQSPIASFALRSLLSKTVRVIATDNFSLTSRKFETQNLIPDLIVTDLDESSLDNAKFDGSNIKSVPRLLAVVPTSTAAAYFFRFQRAKVPFCLLRNGIAPIIETCNLLLTGQPTPPEVTLGSDSFNHLMFGQRNRSDTTLIPEQLKLYLPRLQFDPLTLKVEFEMREGDAAQRMDSLLSTLNVRTREEAIKFGHDSGVSQLPIDRDPIEEKLFEASAMTAIARWLTERKSTQGNA